MGPQEWAIVILVVGARLLFPLAIPLPPAHRRPGALVLDSADQSIFQQFPAIPLDGYQSYDKALDIYYLTITYLSTFRNWTDEYAFKTSLFLFYYPLVGVVAFELPGRAILFIFPNTFEFLHLLRGRPLPVVHRSHGQVDPAPRRRRHLDLRQAAPGMVDPHRAAGHHRFHPGAPLWRERRNQLADTLAARPWMVSRSWRSSWVCSFSPAGSSTPGHLPMTTASSSRRTRSQRGSRTGRPTVGPKPSRRVRPGAGGRGLLLALVTPSSSACSRGWRPVLCGSRSRSASSYSSTRR